MRNPSSPVCLRLPVPDWSLFPLFAGLEAQDMAPAAPISTQSSIIRYSVRVVLVGVATLLVSTLPLWSFKNFKVPSAYVLPIAARHRSVRCGAGGRPLGGTRGRRIDLPGYAAAQPAQLSSTCATAAEGTDPVGIDQSRVLVADEAGMLRQAIV